MTDAVELVIGEFRGDVKEYGQILRSNPDQSRGVWHFPDHGVKKFPFFRGEIINRRRKLCAHRTGVMQIFRPL